MVNYLNIFVVFLVVVLFSGSSSSESPPINVDKYTVVIIEETELRQLLPPSQLSAINSKVWRDYVSEKNGQWRVLDPDSDVSKDHDWVKESLNLKRDGLPWLILSNNKKGLSIPLPKNLDLLMEKIKQ
tara:strand:+ start:1514 stop:1897 length:384 start_codon:yes stop_codon:yes gene_type:complete